MIKNFLIFDCDGVLVDSSHRYRTIGNPKKIDLPYWVENCTRSKIFKDKLLPMAKVYQRELLNPESFVMIATARVCQAADYDFIDKILGKPQHFLCRKKGNTESGITLKLRGIKRLLNLKQFQNATITFFEDNLDYLNGVGDAIGAKKVYIPSNQGY